jgi:hypothetical protein
MNHRWGFALSRRHWLERKIIVDEYLNLLGPGDYRFRDNEAIIAYFRKLGFDIYGTSQDAAKDVAMLLIGRAKLMSYVSFGKYIGEVGVHFNSNLYSDYQYSRTHVYDGTPAFEFPTDEEIDNLIRVEQAKYVLSPNISFDAETIVTELYRGLLGRDPDGEGLQNWVRHLKKASLGDVFAQFISSPEVSLRFKLLSSPNEKTTLADKPTSPRDDHHPSDL